MNTSPLKAIKEFCLDCSGDNHNEVKKCTNDKCPLFNFRLGKNMTTKKREMTEEQKQAARERFMKYWEKKNEERTISESDK